MSKLRTTAEAMVVTANTLRAGAVAFRASDGSWTSDVTQAAVAESEEAAESLLAAAQADAAACLVVEPALVAVSRKEGRVRLANLRERIRADGPTVGSSLTAPPRPRSPQA